MFRSSILPALLLAAAACTPTEAGPATVASSAGAPAAASAKPASAELAVSFDPKAGQLPEGLAIRGDETYVGLAPTGTILRVDLQTGRSEPFADLPKPVPNKGFMTGLAIDSRGAVYAALVSFTPEVQAGIYRVPASGGHATLFAHHDKMAFPNGLAFDERGILYVTDSASGSVFRVSPSGSIERWAEGEALTGSKDFCGPGVGAGFDIGANGIMVEKDAVYVDNNDRGTVLRFARTDGPAGAPEVVVGPDCASLGGADGLTRDAAGNLLVAVNRQDKVVRVTSKHSIEPVVSGGTIDFPASFAWKGTTLFATNFAFATASSGKPAKPGILRIEL